MRQLEANEAIRGVGRIPVRCTHGDGILKQVQVVDHPAPGSAMDRAGAPHAQKVMVTVARHYGPDVVVPIDAVQMLEYGDAPIPEGREVVSGPAERLVRPIPKGKGK